MSPCQFRHSDRRLLLHTVQRNLTSRTHHQTLQTLLIRHADTLWHVLTTDLYLLHYKSPTAPLDMHHLTFGINSVLHSVNLIVFTLLLVHLILRISPHHSHHLRSHHLSRPPPFTPDLELISFTNPFLHSHSYSFRTDFTDLNLYCIKGALALFVLVSFSGYVC